MNRISHYKYPFRDEDMLVADAQAVYCAQVALQTRGTFRECQREAKAALIALNALMAAISSQQQELVAPGTKE